MKTVEDLVVAAKCRKGSAVDVDERGAYWVALSVCTRAYGSGGIGNEAPSVEVILELRHYRSGGVVAFLRKEQWHQNTGENVLEMETPPDTILSCTTVEDVVVSLYDMDIEDPQDCPESTAAYHRSKYPEVKREFARLGLIVALPGPDEDGA